MPVILLTLILSLGLITASCKKPPSRSSFGDKSNLDGSKKPPRVIDPFKEPEKLSLTVLKSEDESGKAFDLTKSMELRWNSAHAIVMSHSDGQTLSYDFQAKAWTAIHSSDIRNEFQTIFDFREAGFFAIATDGFSSRMMDSKIVRLKAPKDFDEKNMVGTNPGFVGYKAADGVRVVLMKEEGARLYRLDKAPAGLKLVYPCNLHCLVWGFDGSRISIFMEDSGWQVLSQVIELPDDEEVQRMAIRFRIENNPVAAEGIFIQTSKGGLFAQVASTAPTAPKTEEDWEDILVMSKHYCVSCHLEDGFDKKATWTGLKSSIVERLKLMPGAKGAMPPIETKLGRQMVAGERATMLSWIEKQTQTKRGEVGMGTENDTSDISGNLKKLADPHCIGCHADANKTAWWKMRKGDVISRVKAGTMPKGKSISADLKAQFEEAVSALK